MATIGKDISTARRILESGGLVSIPTETVYGLAANALDADAVTAIFIAKERPSFDPLIIHVPSIDHVNKYADYFPEMAIKLAEHFWPGPLTIVLPKKTIIPDTVTSGLDTVGIRCPDHPITSLLLAELAFPLAAPSANPFGYVSPTTADHVHDQLGSKIEYILDGGPCRVGLESTIIGFERDKPVIYRRGGISETDIETVVGKVSLKIQSSSNPIAPGQLESHYSPRKKMVLGNIELLKKEFSDTRAAVLRFTKEGPASADEIILSEKGDIVEAASHLFAALRQLDQMNVDVILAEKVPDVGLGKAINDRLQRAARK